MKQRNKQLGFTLMELLIVVAIIAIIAAIGGSSYSYISKKKQVEGLISNVNSALQTARSTAYDSGRTVTVCAVNNVTAILGNSTACQGNWSIFNNLALRANSGWVIFNDQNSDGNIDNNGASPERVYEVVPFAATNPNLRLDIFTAGGIPPTSGTIAFSPLGRSGAVSNLFIRAYSSTTALPWSASIDSHTMENRMTVSPLGLLSVATSN